MDFLEYSDIKFENRGAMSSGRLKFTDSHIVFKNSKTGKVEQIAATELDLVTWQRFAGYWGIRIFGKNGNLYRFGGFKETDKEKVSKFFSNRYDKNMMDRDLCLKGWNWGTAKFQGSVLGFDVSNNLDFEIPLNYVSQCLTAKNEVTLEFHQNDDAPVSLMELRFHIPSSELAGDDPVDAFQQQVMGKAGIISAAGDAIAIFREVQVLTPRGRYDIKIYQSFFQLHGKTFDYKIPMSTVLRLFLLPHKDGRQMFFVISLDPPIKQGQTRYHYLVFLFSQEEEASIELPLSDEELKKKYDGKLSKDITGPMYDVISRVMKGMVNRKIRIPGQFIGFSGTPAVGCSYKAAAGYMYPLERGFIYVHKPPLHIRFEEITSVNFARSGGSTRSFDFEVETKTGVVHTFSSIEKEEYIKLYDFIIAKKLRVKNHGKLDKPAYAGDFDDSDAEAEPDAYLTRVKAEAEERSDDDDDEGSSEDEDFDPDKVKQESDVADEFETDPSSSGSDVSGSGSDDGAKKKKKQKKAKTVREPGMRKKRTKTKKDKDPNAPKKPQTGYMLSFNENRNSIKEKYPDLAFIEIAKKGGELWRELTDKSKYEEKAKKLYAEYKEKMEEYKKNAPPKETSGESSSKSQKKPKSSGKEKTSKGSAKSGAATSAFGAGKGFKSKEFISDSESASGGGSASGSGSGSGEDSD